MKNTTLNIEQFRITRGNQLDFDDTQRFPTRLRDAISSDKEYASLMHAEHDRMATLQEMLAASKTSAFLVAIQALDAAGKDSLVKHGFAGLNVFGTRVVSFKAPTKEELAEDFLARHTRALPALGELGVWIRSHYEEVSAVRVHPEFLKGRGVDLNTVDKEFWAERIQQIRAWEDALPKQKTGIAKIFLHASTAVRMERLLDRLEQPDKFWKSSLDDIKELDFVPQYQRAFAEAINATSTDRSPWYVIPADNKKVARVLGAQVLNHELERQNLRYPERSSEERREMADAAEKLKRLLKSHAP